MRNSFLFSILILALATAADAAPRRSKAKKAVTPPEPPKIEERALEVPQPQLDLRAPAPQAVNSGMQIEATTSTWQPRPFSSPSFLGDTSQFSATSEPSVSVNGMSAGWDLGAVAILPRFGFSYSRVERSGRLVLPGGDQTVRQNLALYSGRFGLEFAPSARGRFVPFANVALVPTWIMSPASQFDKGVSQTVFSVEGALGVAWNIETLASFVNARELGFEAGLVGTEGLNGSPMSGAGIVVGMRVGL